MAPEWACCQLDWLAAAQDQGAMGNGHWAALRVGGRPLAIGPPRESLGGHSAHAAPLAAAPDPKGRPPLWQAAPLASRRATGADPAARRASQMRLASPERRPCTIGDWPWRHFTRSLACGFGFGDDNWRLFACVCP